MDQALKTRPSTSSVGAEHTSKRTHESRSSPSEIKGSDANLKKDVSHMICEVMTMNASLSALLQVLTDDVCVDTFAIHEAMGACLQRMERAIETVDDRTTNAGWGAP